MTEHIKLPPMPNAFAWAGVNESLAKAVQAYTIEAIEVDRQARGEPIGECHPNVLLYGAGNCDMIYPVGYYQDGRGVKLYPAPQPQQIPEGYKLVPVEPTEDQWSGLARAFIKAWEFGCKTPRSMFKFIEGCGGEIPQWVREEPEMKNLDHVPSKGTRAVLIYKAMLEAAPEPKEP